MLLLRHLLQPSSTSMSTSTSTSTSSLLKVLSLTQVVGDFIHVLEGFHPQTDDVHKVLHQPEELPDVWTQLRDPEGREGKAKRKRRVSEELQISSE